MTDNPIEPANPFDKINPYEHIKPYEPKVNQKYRAGVLEDILSETKICLEVYNALSGENFPLDTTIMNVTLEDVLYKNKINDVAFLIKGENDEDNKIVVLIEHQSTVNPNMPFRFCNYAMRVMDKVVNNEDVFSRKLMELPTLEFYVFYNGDEDYPEISLMELSSAFKRPWKVLLEKYGRRNAIEVNAIVYNINKGFNNEIISKSPTLSGYVELVYRVKQNKKDGLNLTKAVTKAVRDCIKDGILSDYLKNVGSEVCNMLMQEWSIEDELRVNYNDGVYFGRKEGLKEGLKEGERKGEQKGLLKGMTVGMKKGRKEGKLEGRNRHAVESARKMLMDGLSVEMIAKYSGLSLEKVRALRRKMVQ
jgi:hypothetical protein